MAKQLEPKLVKHQQHLKLQKENEEESWISGEELHTDGSSDEEQKNYKTHKRVKNRRPSGERKDETLHMVSSKLTKELTMEENKLLEKCVTEEGAASAPVCWRPKRGSIKLPNLYEGFLDEQGKTILTNYNLYHDEHNAFKSLPVLQTQDIKNITNYDDEVEAVIDSINKLEERFIENMERLEGEKRERLKIEEEMCFEIRNDDEFDDKNATLFIKLCGFERNNCADNNDNNNGDEIDKNQKKKKSVVNPVNNGKNFIQRNIELAAKAMSKLSLTDEEKQQLEQILADIDLSDVQEEDRSGNVRIIETETNEKAIPGNENKEIIKENAFHLSKNDQARLSEIDLELQTKFSETQNLRSSNSEGEVNFWRNLVLDQMLKDIDHKLTVLKNEENDATQQ